MRLSLEQWQSDGTTLALEFRLGHNVEAGLTLVTYLERLVTACPLFPTDQQRQFQSILSAILACQEKQDWLGLADYLEYELQQLFTELN